MKCFGISLSALPLLMLAFISPAGAGSEPATYTISLDGGGTIVDYVARYKLLEATGVNLKIDGLCISACTIFLGIFPADRVCVTERASLGFHEASNGETGDLLPEATKAWARYLYPEWVLDWIARTGGLSKEPRYMFAEDMRDHIKLCPGSHYSGVDPKKFIAPEPEQSKETIIFHPPVQHNGGK